MRESTTAAKATRSKPSPRVAATLVTPSWWTAPRVRPAAREEWPPLELRFWGARVSPEATRR